MWLCRPVAKKVNILIQIQIRPDVLTFFVRCLQMHSDRPDFLSVFFLTLVQFYNISTCGALSSEYTYTYTYAQYVLKPIFFCGHILVIVRSELYTNIYGVLSTNSSQDRSGFTFKNNVMHVTRSSQERKKQKYFCFTATYISKSVDYASEV
jgi:hypothetical protein